MYRSQNLIKIARRVGFSTASNHKSDIKSIQMPTPLSIGFDMTYQQASSNVEEGNRPMVVIAGWMGAKEKQLKPYLSFYHNKNIDTLSFAVGPKHVLFPSEAKKQMESVLGYVSDPEKSGIKTPSCIIFHHFSVGGFLYGLILLLLKDSNRFTNVSAIIRAQIFDSPPDYKSIPKGIARSMGIDGIAENIIEFSARTYLKLSENYAGVLHRASSDAFHRNSIPAPSLWFYSKADPVARIEDCVTIVEKWKSRGTIVQECVWEDTPHIQHARYDPKRYFGTLEKFLKDHKIIA